MAGRPRGRAVFALLAFSIAFASAGCSHGGSDASSGAGSAASATAEPWAANAGEVTRFADEVPFGPEAVIARDKTPVRKSPGGDVVTTLPSGVEVTKLSAHGDEALVCFEESDGGRAAPRRLGGAVGAAGLDPSARPRADARRGRGQRPARPFPSGAARRTPSPPAQTAAAAVTLPPRQE